jgi:ATP-dependent Lhr-like helicase
MACSLWPMTKPVPDLFHPAVRHWFASAFGSPTAPQALGWPAIAKGQSTLILSPTGSGKTLAAFLWAIERVMFSPVPDRGRRCRVLYISPLKALAVDVERNLRAPLVGIANVARARGDTFTVPEVAIRTGDTPASDRARFQREPADILITTPESLYLLLTSRAREALRSVETVIVDEIHALVPTKRGTHLALSLERLNALCERPPQRIGLSATQRPLDEVARFLGGVVQKAPQPDRSTRRGRTLSARRDRAQDGGGVSADLQALGLGGGTAPGRQRQSPARDQLEYRPVTIVDAREPKQLRLSVEVPVEDMAKLAQAAEVRSGPASQGPAAPSIWSGIHPRLLELIQAHRSTLLFVNNRRLAERLAAALNELAGATIARSHHGSIAREQRIEVEDLLKLGRIRALVATSSLELGIDMGAIDLVVQIEAPRSVASGMQRIGRAGHQVGAVSEGIIFPKYRGDLVTSAAVTSAMYGARIEATRYPRNPLDVLAQQIVAMTSVDEWDVDRLYATVRSAAPFAGLGRRVFEGVLDMLSGRYPSDEFAELRPRITWDRIGHTIRAREGAKRVAIANAGTIPDRGLYGVFLAGAAKGSGRVGELDEEMVFESSVGETFVLGASTWRIEEITHDRVIVSPAPGEPGKMPFWRGDQAGRPIELGYAIGRLIRELRSMPPPAAIDRLMRQHGLDRAAAENLLRYLADQASATRAVPDDHTIVIERCRDELGDWRVCVLSPLGGRVHAPWAMAVVARVREERGLDVETMWTDDGFVARFPETEEPPDTSLILPAAADVEPLVMRQLGGSALFAGKFREVAGRSLLLPRRRPGARAPLWQQRKRASDLLAVASRFGSFPAVLETYRECLQDLFDLPALVDVLSRIADRSLRVVTVDPDSPSPFASSLLFTYVANYLYDGDAPLAERRAQALAVDQDQLRELLGEAELRELLDAGVIEELERQLQHLDGRHPARSVDALHDLLLRIGDLTLEEIAARSDLTDTSAAIEELVRTRRAIWLHVADSGQGNRLVAVEDASRYRDALGIPLPLGLPEALVEPVADPMGDLALRYARTHGPFIAEAFATRFGLAIITATQSLERLGRTGRLIQGEFRPGGAGREWCEVEVLRQLRRRSLAKLRHEVEPVSARALTRFITTWQGVTRRRAGLEALLDTVEQLQGAPLPASLVEREILPARVDGYHPADLDTLMAAGEVVWIGLDQLGERDGRVALFLTDHLGDLRPPSAGPTLDDERQAHIVRFLRERGASFFQAIHAACGGGYPDDTVRAIWDLVWSGAVTNDALHALRAFTEPPPRRTRAGARRAFRSRRRVPPAAEGRWSLVESSAGEPRSATRWAAAVASQLLTRYGIVTRETIAAEGIPGGFAAVYDVLKAMEEAGRIRRGYFVAGLGAMQFALPAALDLLRSLRDEQDEVTTVHLTATDPANPYGVILKWPSPEAPTGTASAPAAGGPAAGLAPERPVPTRSSFDGAQDERREGAGRRALSRSVGATVILVNGALSAYIARGDQLLWVFLPEDEPDRASVAERTAGALMSLAAGQDSDRQGMLIREINGRSAPEHPFAPFLLQAGFLRRPVGLQAVRPKRTTELPTESGTPDAE